MFSMTNKNYITSVSLSNVTRNKLIALANVYKTTQKELLNALIDKEIKQLNSKEKNDFTCILKAIEVKDAFRNTKRGNNNDKETR